MGEEFPGQATDIVGEFLMDPIVRMLMKADNVDERELRAMFDRITAALATDSVEPGPVQPADVQHSGAPEDIEPALALCF